ncbi:MAG: alpha-glucan family phosphorylase [Deltaproteobacteria bacterium]|nr:alpha-glucan family phosphorylase [Deltaproteobacteria bacterium]
MNDNICDRKYLFEVSWEVCNKVGGINTVLRTKAGQAVEHFGDRYILVGPDTGHNPEFEETDEALWAEVKRQAFDRGLTCRCGRWDIEGRPRVVLVNQNNKYETDKLLFQLWHDYGVDSMTGGWDYIEPVLFSTAAGEIIEILHRQVNEEDEVSIAQFHEWMTGAGMLYVKKHVPEIATVLTTHATMLGRSLAGSGTDIYTNIEEITPSSMAAKMNITAKHSLETVSARESDCFTTVSDITAGEAAHFLQRSPDLVLPNGMNITAISDCAKHRDDVSQRRAALIQFAEKFLQEDLDGDNVTFFIISGRYEFRNKGMDLFLESLKRISDFLKSSNSAAKIVTIFSVIGGHLGISNETRQILQGVDVQRSGIARICTHQLRDPQYDPIWNTCSRLGLNNDRDDHVKIIFMPVYLDGYDGLLNIPYYEVLSGCDLGVFPSYYEPWGYTPLESASYCVPTVTTDLAGFGIWVKNHFENNNRGVIVLEYRNRSHDQIVECLTNHISELLEWSDEEREAQRVKARAIAEKTDWREFYPFYLKAYSHAVRKVTERVHVLDTSAYRREIYYTGTDSLQPRFKTFSVVAALPDKIKDLRKIAYNLFWTWNVEVQDLFARLDPQLWADVCHNPIELLERISSDRLWEMTKNESFLRLYARSLELMKDMRGDEEFTLQRDPSITTERPIAYFSTEYGLHQSLPIYSGGLGILSGDHIKSASNLNIPMVGVGLLYKSGYFAQAVDKEGNQLASYPENDFSRMPVKMCDGGTNEPVKIHVDLPGRKLYAQIWKIDVGRVPLYLLDTYVPENNTQDMQITSRLYGADHRLRIEQEIMLGIGGVKLLHALGIEPSVYHLNEGHSAFLLIERIHRFIKHDGLSFNEAREVVKASSVFTTHSPVEAANERFEESLMKSYFSEYIKSLGISWGDFWELGREEPGADRPFFMPVLAFKLSCASNAVSKLHGNVARRMWKNVWSGFEIDEIPIVAITNGVHMQSWTAPEMKSLYERYLGIDWYSKNYDMSNWSKVDDIPDKLLWHTHEDLKMKMVDFLRRRLTDDCEKKGLSPTLIREKAGSLDSNAFIIGFGRRFAAYKRADLLFSDPDRLADILDSAPGKIQFVFAGKAHPNDDAGKALIKKIYALSMEDRFMDRIFFIENYNTETARYIVQGVDMWLNNPLRPREASGTSGMKVVVNGGLNVSILDGWWDEGYDGNNGWAIGGKREYANLESQNLIDSQSLYEILENSIITTYYDINAEGIPEQWVRKMKQSIKTLVPRFNTHRMLREYYDTMYLPAARRSHELRENRYERARALAEWKSKIASRFSTDHIRWYRARGFRGDRLDLGDEFEVEVGIDLGRLTEDEIRVELVILESDEQDSLRHPVIIPMEKGEVVSDDATAVYVGSYQALQSGKFAHGIRVIPYHKDLFTYQEVGLVHWA